MSQIQSQSQIQWMSQEELNLIINQAGLLALLPLEQWMSQLEKAETIAPYIDPTLYREYVHSRKPEVIKAVLKAALRFSETVKKAVLEGVTDEVPR